jgi:hypothetical protein
MRYSLKSAEGENVVKKTQLVSAILVALIAAAVPVFAHHSWPVDMSKLVTVKGTITAVSWENPHPMFSIDVTTPDKKMEKWTIGGPAITRMEANGWTSKTLKRGDTITGIGFQFSDGQKILRLEKVVLPDGREINVYGR